MSLECTRQLDRLGRTLNRWEAQVRGAWCIAIALGWLAALSLVDVLVQVGRAGRAVSAAGLLALIGFAAWQCVKALQRSFSREGVAARVERAFPELDNHLINYLQFSRDRDGNVFKDAYVAQGEPRWQGLDFRQMKNRRAHRRSGATLAGVVALMLILWAALGSTWGVAVWRMVNPFSSAEPVTLTKLLAVTPGDTTVLQGEPLLIEATVKGFSGHPVKIDLEPDDGDKKTIVLGSISSTREQPFSHRLPRVNASVRYRVRAGDARPSDWFEVTTRPPPAFTGVALTMTPPAYTKKGAATYDGLADECIVYQGATVALNVSCNTPLASAQLMPKGGEPVSLSQAGSDREWSGSTTLLGGHGFTLQAVDVYGMAFEEQVAYQLVPDRPPALEIVEPRGRVQLPPGQVPRIEYSVMDDYGLVSAVVQEVSGDEDGAVLRTWELNNAPTHAAVWTRETAIRSGGDVAYRVVVKDNCPFTEQVSRSLPLTFSTTSHSDAAKQRNELEKQAVAGMQQIIELQRTNLSRTEALLAGIDRTTAANWEGTSARQRTIRSTTRDLLANPMKPFGGMTTTVKKLYLEEMTAAVRALEDIPGADDAQKPGLGADAVRLQQQILKQLGHAQTEAASAATERRASALSSMLTALVREQSEVLKTTRKFIQSKAKVGIALVDAQDFLPEDLTAFVKACVAEAEAVRGNDDAFAATLDGIAAQCESLKIRNNMVLAAERLDQDLPADAVPFAENALQALQTLQAALDTVSLEQETEKRTVLAEALSDAKEKLERVRDLRGRMLDHMDALRGQEDQSDGAIEAIEEAYEELVANTQETVLEIPTDLHTFADMTAANELVEDVFEVFQEIEQVEEEQTTDDGAEEDEGPQLLDFAKEDANLELMDEAIERIDEIETWLLDNPDEKRVTAEAFDREEMPEEGIAKGDLAEAVEDLISDLLEENQEDEDEAQDSATTHGVTDMETGWGVEEGETVTFSAKGKSGNRTPDHKEQDGRSNVGRQGMAVGETAAASGTINEGDPDIEERRTEDPVQGGQIDLAGEADTRATGGGKKGTGKADEFGMTGGVKRLDSFEQGSWEGMAALMAKQADALYAKASLKNVRVDALKEAAHHLRQADDAIARGDIEQMKEFRRLAAVSLQRAQAQLEAGPSQAIDTGGTGAFVEDVVEGGSDLAPPAYRDQVADYYRALNEVL